MRQVRRLAWSLGVALACAALARGADGPPLGVKELKDPKGIFTLQVPESWKTAPGGGGRLSAEAPDRSALLEVRSGPPDGATLEECAKALVKTATETLRPWTETAREKVRLADLDALHIRGASKGVQELATEHYLLLAKGGKVEIRLDFVCPADQAEKHKDTLKAILASLRVREGGPSATPGAQPQEGPATTPDEEEVTIIPTTLKRVKDPGGWFTFCVPEDWKVDEAAACVEARPPGELTRVSVRRTPREISTLQKYVRDYLKSEKDMVTGWTKIGERIIQIAGRQAAQVHAEGEGVGEEEATEMMVADYVFFSGDRHHFSMVLACPKAKLRIYQALFAQIMGSLELTAPLAGAWIDPAAQSQAPAGPAKGPEAAPGAPPTKKAEDPGGAFALALPADWQVQQKPGRTTASDPTRRAALVITAEPKEAKDLEDYTETLTATWRLIPGWVQAEWRAIQVANLPACHIRATSTPAGRAIASEYILVLTETRQILLTLSCPQAEAEQFQPVFQQIIRSLQPR